MTTTIVSISDASDFKGDIQVHLLPNDHRILRFGNIFDEDQELKSKLEREDWWWESSTAEFVSEIIEAAQRRHSTITSAGSHHDLVILHGGSRWIEAVALAMIAIKEHNEDLTAAQAELDHIISKAGLVIPREDYAILIKHSSNTEGDTAMPSNNRSDTIASRDKRFGVMLDRVFESQASAGRYDSICVETGRDQSQKTQDAIRRYLSSLKILPDLMKPTLERIETIYALAGLSECGKSTVADLIHQAHGTSCARLKMSYFLAGASNKLGYDVYTLSGERRAAALLQGLDNFGHYQWYLSTLTIESVHRYDSISHLKTWLGPRLQLIYIDTNEDVRLERSGHPKSRLEKKDSMKKERGADRVKGIADIVLDNNGTKEDLQKTLQAFMQRVALNRSKVSE